jgi:hypothetical protein
LPRTFQVFAMTKRKSSECQGKRTHNNMCALHCHHTATQTIDNGLRYPRHPMVLRSHRTLCCYLTPESYQIAWLAARTEWHARSSPAPPHLANFIHLTSVSSQGLSQRAEKKPSCDFPIIAVIYPRHKIQGVTNRRISWQKITESLTSGCSTPHLSI